MTFMSRKEMTPDNTPKEIYKQKRKEIQAMKRELSKNLNRIDKLKKDWSVVASLDFMQMKIKEINDHFKSIKK